MKTLLATFLIMVLGAILVFTLIALCMEYIIFHSVSWQTWLTILALLVAELGLMKWKES